jgi:ribonuclease E
VAEAALNGEEFNAAPPERNRQERGERAERNERGERGEGRRERQNRNADAQPAMQAVADEAALNTAQSKVLTLRCRMAHKAARLASPVSAVRATAMAVTAATVHRATPSEGQAAEQTAEAGPGRSACRRRWRAASTPQLL